MKINWKVRIKNKTFWLTLIPAVILIVQLVAGWFGYQVPAEVINQEAKSLINAVFGVLVILGIVNDPTVDGNSDSRQAMSYQRPKKDVKK